MRFYAPIRAIDAPPATWKWPIDPTKYDRTAALSAHERRVLTREVFPAVSAGHYTRIALRAARGIERLRAPLEDAVAVIGGNTQYANRAELMILKWCVRTGTAFWCWDRSTWRTILGTTQQDFFAAHVPTPKAGGERHVLIAIAYLLRCFNDIPALGEVHRVGVAEKIFGPNRIAYTLKRVTDVAVGWGYHYSRRLMCVVAELFLINQRPELESLSIELLESVKERWSNSNERSALYYQLYRVLHALGILSDPPHPGPLVQASTRIARNAGISPEWITIVERWEATSTLTAQTRAHRRDSLLKAGRWLQATHAEITSPEQWTRELAAEYVAAVARMNVGDYVCRTVALGQSRGKPLSARSKDQYLDALRCFFADAQEWEWVSRRFNPFRAFATPRSIKALIGPSPRTIADDLWAKLLWAGLNLTVADLSSHGAVRSNRSTVGDVTHRDGRSSGYYPLEMLRALSVVWLFAGLRSAEIVRLRLGCARPQPSLQSLPQNTSCWVLDVPVHKTGTALTKPIDGVVGEAIRAWEAVRPRQPRADDSKTGESVDFLFCFRAKKLPREYLNQGLIPMLCRKAGIPTSDARGSISSHRARSTIASQLFNAKEPMTLFELQAWLGHRSPASTQHYVAFTPTRLARAYTEAHYFQRNLRMMEVLIDPQAIKSGASETPWRYYDLGHGFCSYEFFDQCPHRMACARCNFYVPKQSSQGDLITSKAAMIHMLQEIPLTDDERAAVDGDVTAIETLLKRLQTTPTPDKVSCAQPLPTGKSATTEKRQRR
jgi:integrase